MLEDLSVIDNEVYDLGLQEIEEAANIQKQIKALELQRDEKIEEAKIHLMLGIKVKTRELQSKLEICNKQIVAYHLIIGKIKQELKDNYQNLEEDELHNKLIENQQKLSLWLWKKDEIKTLLEKLCIRYGHQIDTSENVLKTEFKTEKDERGQIEDLEVLQYYTCKCCGKVITTKDNFGIKDMEWHNVLNAKFGKRISDQEVIFESPKLVLGRPKVVLPHVDK